MTVLLDTVRRCVGVAALLMAIMNISGARAEGEAPRRTAAQLEQLVAPLALYPDAVLSQVLMASTYPLEVVEAARWSQANPGVTGQALEDAMQKQSWDPSVKALTAVPQTLQMMNDKLEWTRELGDAFLAQQADVLDAVQRLRQRADNAGNLKTTQQQRVTKTPAPRGTAPGGATPQPSSAPATIYTIEPANPDEYYVPIYDPGVVYGAWPYPDYAPFYWYPPGYAAGNVFSFAAGVFVGAAIWGNIDWGRRSVAINVNRYNRFNHTQITNRTWTHNPAHRGNVPYRDRNVAQRFGNPSQAAAREAFRGKANTGRQELGRQGAGKAGQKGAAQRTATGTAKGVAAGKGGAAKQVRANQGVQPKQTAKSKQAGKTKQAARSNQGARHAAPQRNVSRQPAAKHAARPAGGGRAHAAHAGGGRGGGRGGRRSDIRLKHDIELLGRLENGLGYYRFVYNGGDKAYVGVIAQEVQTVVPEAVARDRHGYLKVLYDKLGLKFQTYEQWRVGGARLPSTAAPHP
jgi:hypothetical protein